MVELPGIMHARFWTVSLFLSMAVSATAQQEVTEKETEPIEVVATQSDEAIEGRLEEIFSALGDFEKIDVEVTSGIVTLSGEVSSEALRREALTLAERIDGVVLARDRLVDPAQIADRFAPAVEKLREMGRIGIAKAPLVAVALLIVIGAWCLTRLLERRRSWLDRLHLSSLGRQLLLRVLKAVIMLLSLVVALELLDATAVVGAVMGAAGLMGLALGFAFKSIVENYLAGVLLSTRNPFEIGDVIEIDGKLGKVARLTARDTVLVTLAGNHLRIPNAMVINSVLLNLTRNPRRRFEFDVGVSTEFDLTEARRTGTEVLRSIPAILEEPAPMGIIETLGDSSVVMRFFAWVDQDYASYPRVRSEAIRLVKEAFDEKGIEMPEPIYRLHLREGKFPPHREPDREKQGGETDQGERSSTLESEARVEEDLSVDRTIDKQIAEEESVSTEENFLKS